jgi:hypothetical protein
MPYFPLPPGTTLTPMEYEVEMNKALPCVDGFRRGMEVKCDDRGCWLEESGLPCVDAGIFLSAASSLVLNNKRG